MSTPQKSKTNPSIRQSPPIMIGAAIIVLCLIGIGVVSFLAGKHEGEKQVGQNRIITYSQQKQPTILGDQVNSWNGTIVSMSDKKMIFSIPGTTPDSKPQQISAIITPTTQLMKWDLTKPQSVGTPDDTSKEFITHDQLSAGKRVLVQANTDVNDKQEVEATNISLIITPANK